MKSLILMGGLITALVLAGCGQMPQVSSVGVAQETPVEYAIAQAGKGPTNMNGRGGAMPVFYDAQLFTVNFKLMPANATASLLAHNGSINTIYECDACAPTLNFVPVLDAIQGDGFNPLWQEVQIVPLGTPMQFTSDNDILAAAQAGTIRLVPTTEVYRCSVIGPNKP